MKFCCGLVREVETTGNGCNHGLNILYAHRRVRFEAQHGNGAQTFVVGFGDTYSDTCHMLSLKSTVTPCVVPYSCPIEYKLTPGYLKMKKKTLQPLPDF